MNKEYQGPSNSTNDSDNPVNATREASLTLHSLTHTTTDQTTRFILPALQTWRALPVEPLRLITEFARNVYDFRKVYPDGFRDNNEYRYVCRLCGFG